MSTTSAAADYLARPYSRVVVPDPAVGFFAKILEFPGCFAEGETIGDTYRNLESAALAWIEASLDQGGTIPEPIEEETHSGKVLLRLPKSLHRRAAAGAQRDGTSLNQFIVAAVAECVGFRGAVRQLAATTSAESTPLTLPVRLAAGAPETTPLTIEWPQPDRGGSDYREAMHFRSRATVQYYGPAD